MRKYDATLGTAEHNEAHRVDPSIGPFDRRLASNIDRPGSIYDERRSCPPCAQEHGVGQHGDLRAGRQARNSNRDGVVQQAFLR